MHIAPRGALKTLFARMDEPDIYKAPPRPKGLASFEGDGESSISNPKP